MDKNKNSKFYKCGESNNVNMLPGNPKGLPDDFLWTCFERKRNSPFSRCNELINSVDVCVKLTKEDFEEAKI